MQLRADRPCSILLLVGSRLGNEKFKSKVVWKTLHPSWLEQFDLHLYDDQEQVLEVTVWDKDKQTKDDFLGR